ncbi:MAG: thioredoxin fold domain-containing protein [Thiotrichaceae bacterium]|nr:thioredoxin fold domain-containing protein [Thiotrichaceae bacterium]
MKSKLYLPAVLLIILSAFISQTVIAETGKVTGGIDFETPSWFKDSFLEIAEDVAEASESGKHVLMFFHLNGCPYCNKMINHNFQQEPLKSQIQVNFDSIEINIKGDREIAMSDDLTTTESILANYLKVKYTPTILFLDDNNKTVLRLNGYRSPEALKQALDFVQHKAYEKSSFSEYKRSNMKYGQYQFIDNPLFVKTTDFSTLKTPVAILFEDNDCNECKLFHDKMLSRDEIQQQLKNYHVVRLDAKSTQPIIDFNGQKTTARDWAEALAISYRPGLVLFDEGKEIARTESMLYPFHFEHVLRLV